MRFGSASVITVGTNTNANAMSETTDLNQKCAGFSIHVATQYTAVLGPWDDT